MNIALYPAETIGVSLAVTLFNHHRRTGETSTLAQLVEIPRLPARTRGRNREQPG